MSGKQRFPVQSDIGGVIGLIPIAQYFGSQRTLEHFIVNAPHRTNATTTNLANWPVPGWKPGEPNWWRGRQHDQFTYPVRIDLRKLRCQLGRINGLPTTTAKFHFQMNQLQQNILVEPIGFKSTVLVFDQVLKKLADRKFVLGLPTQLQRITTAFRVVGI